MVILHRFQGELLNCTSFDQEHHGAYVVLVSVCAVFLRRAPQCARKAPAGRRPHSLQ